MSAQNKDEKKSKKGNENLLEIEIAPGKKLSFLVEQNYIESKIYFSTETVLDDIKEDVWQEAIF
jgi:hypothetical protein